MYFHLAVISPFSLLNGLQFVAAPCSQKAAMSSLASKIKAYSVPLFLFSLSVFYQLFVLPRSFPTSHYDGIDLLVPSLYLYTINCISDCFFCK